MKKIKYYVLYDKDNCPICYFETLKEFSEKLNYDYKYLKNKFCTINNFIDLLIENEKFKLYKFVD